MPPAPRGARISKGPSLVPAAMVMFVRGADSLPTEGREEVRAAGAGARREGQACGRARIRASRKPVRPKGADLRASEGDGTPLPCLRRPGAQGSRRGPVGFRRRSSWIRASGFYRESPQNPGLRKEIRCARPCDASRGSPRLPFLGKEARGHSSEFDAAASWPLATRGPYVERNSEGSCIETLCFRSRLPRCNRGPHASPPLSFMPRAPSPARKERFRNPAPPEGGIAHAAVHALVSG